jgi:hypothetical protein
MNKKKIIIIKNKKQKIKGKGKKHKTKINEHLGMYPTTRVFIIS